MIALALVCYGAAVFTLGWVIRGEWHEERYRIMVDGELLTATPETDAAVAKVLANAKVQIVNGTWV